MLAKVTGDRVKERRATRGLAAAARMQGQLRQAVKHLERVLEISRDIREHVGDADAYGTIAGAPWGVVVACGLQKVDWQCS
jgi:hypothetical protein